MPRKKATTLAQAVAMTPSIQEIVNSSEFDLATKRQKVLLELGQKRPKKRYATVEERKAAAKARNKKRREERNAALRPYGLGPRPKGPKLTKEQRKEKRKARGKVKRQFMREMAKANPEKALKFGIDVTRFKL